VGLASNYGQIPIPAQEFESASPLGGQWNGGPEEFSQLELVSKFERVAIFTGFAIAWLRARLSFGDKASGGRRPKA
jgi:hypothetical protein